MSERRAEWTLLAVDAAGCGTFARDHHRICWRAAAAAEPRASPVGLAAKLATVAERAHGKVGVSVVHVESRDVAPGAPSNTRRWCNLPVAVTVQQLLEFPWSTATTPRATSYELLELVGGPVELTRRIRTLGFPDIDIRGSTKEIATAPQHPNHGSAAGLARLLSALQLRPTEL
jgi:hypothetical protein